MERVTPTEFLPSGQQIGEGAWGCMSWTGATPTEYVPSGEVIGECAWEGGSQMHIEAHGNARSVHGPAFRAAPLPPLMGV